MPGQTRPRRSFLAAAVGAPILCAAGAVPGHVAASEVDAIALEIDRTLERIARDRAALEARFAADSEYWRSLRARLGAISETLDGLLPAGGPQDSMLDPGGTGGLRP